MSEELRYQLLKFIFIQNEPNSYIQDDIIIGVYQIKTMKQKTIS